MSEIKSIVELIEENFTFYMGETNSCLTPNIKILAINVSNEILHIKKLREILNYF